MSHSRSSDISTALMKVTERPPAAMARGSGSLLWDEHGGRYLDFVQGWAVNCLGHAHPDLQAALSAQSVQLWNPSPAFHNLPQSALAAAIVNECDLDRVFFCNTGAEANEGAIKLARKWGSQIGRRNGQARHHVITTEHSFHGRTLATMAASGKPSFRGMFPPLVPGFSHVPYGDLQAVRDAITAETVAIMVEPIQGEAGVIVPAAEYLPGLRALCDEYELLLICDEVQTGLGRTCAMFAHLGSGVTPDIMTLGKGLGGGVPLSALVAKAAVSCFEPGDQGGTFNGNPLMCAVGLEVVRILTSADFLRESAAIAEYLLNKLQRLAAQHGLRETRGRGFLLAVQLPAPTAPAVRDRAQELGLLVNACQPDVIRLMPALNVTREEVDEALDIMDVALSPTR